MIPTYLPTLHTSLAINCVCVKVSLHLTCVREREVGDGGVVDMNWGSGTRIEMEMGDSGI